MVQKETQTTTRTGEDINNVLTEHVHHMMHKMPDFCGIVIAKLSSPLLNIEADFYRLYRNF